MSRSNSANTASIPAKAKGPPAWGGQIKGLAQRNEADLQRHQFLLRGDQIDKRPPPAVETPDDDDINLFASGGTEQFLPLWTCRGA